jgi:hypothetical protein
MRFYAIIFLLSAFHLVFSLSMAQQPFGPWPLFSFSILYIVGRTPWTGDQSVARPLPTHGTIQTENKRTQTSMLLVGFLSMVLVFEQAKTVHALDLEATVIGSYGLSHIIIVYC